MNIVVDLYGNTDAIALSDAKATRKHNLIFDMVLRHGCFQKLDNLLRALEMAR